MVAKNRDSAKKRREDGRRVSLVRITCQPRPIAPFRAMRIGMCSQRKAD